MSRISIRVATLFILAVAGSAIADGSSSPLFGGYFEDSHCSTAYATAASSHNLQTLAAAVKAAGLVSTLDDSSAEITVFAPTDDAFAALASALDLTAAELLAKSELLKVILEYHVFAGDAYEESDFDDHDTLHMVEGETVKVDSVGDIYTVEPAAGSTATILVGDLAACKAYIHIIDTVLIPKAAATALGMTSIDVPGAGVTQSQAVTSVVNKKTTTATPAATAVPVVVVPAATPAATTPAVVVSGARAVPSPTSGVVPSITPTHLAPATTPAATRETIKELVADHTPVPTVLVPAETPAMTKEAVKHLLFGVPEPTTTKEAVLVPTPVTTKAAVTHPLLGTLVAGSSETPKAHPVVTIVEATPEATPAATKAAAHPVLDTFVDDKHKTPSPTPAVVLVPVATPAHTPAAEVTPVATPEETVPAVAVSGARTSTAAAPAVSTFPIVAAIAPAVANVEAVVGDARTMRREAVAPAAAAVAQATTTIRDNRATRLGLATPAATAAPAVEALDGPSVMVPMMAPAMAPEGALGMEVGPMTAPGMAEAPAVMAEQGPTAMAPAMAPVAGMSGFAALTELRVSKPSQCVSPLQAAKMVPALSDFVQVATATNLSSYLDDANLMATVFVPTNAAFEAVLSQFGITTQQALSQPSLLKGLVQYHIVPNMTLTTSDIKDGQTLTTALSGQTLKAVINGTAITIQPATGNAANIVEADVPTCKAELDVVDALLFPSASALPASAVSLLAAGRSSAG